MNKPENKTNLRYFKKRLETLGTLKPPLRRSSLSQKLLIKGENWREFEQMRAEVVAEIGPQTKIESILCEKIISATWKMRRAMIIERNLLNQENEITFEELHPDPWGPRPRKRVRNIDRVQMQSPEVQNIIQYQINLEKGLQKALERIRRIRNDGKYEKK